MKKLLLSFFTFLTVSCLLFSCLNESEQIGLENLFEKENNLSKSKTIINKSSYLKGKIVLWENAFHTYGDSESKDWVLNIPLQGSDTKSVEKIVIYNSPAYLEVVLWRYESNEDLAQKLTFKNHDILKDFTGKVSYLNLKDDSYNELIYEKGILIPLSSEAKFGEGSMNQGVCGRCHNGLGTPDNPIPLDGPVITPGGGNDNPLPPLPPRPPIFTTGTYDIFRNAIKDRPFALYTNDIPCDIIKEWLKTAKHQVRDQEINKLNDIVRTRTFTGTDGSFDFKDVARLQDINNAYSTVINMDYFSVNIDKLPKGTSPESFLNYIRLNINNFVNNKYANFTPYKWHGVNDTKLWNSSNPLGTVIAIDMLGPDNGSVIVTNYSNREWTFSTIYDPKYGSHPISGHRDFGFIQNSNNSYTFYTRGVDRLTDKSAETLYDLSQKLNYDIPFNIADNLWKSFQTKITDYVNSNGGKASVNSPQIKRPDWQLVKDVINGKKPLKSLSNDCK